MDAVVATVDDVKAYAEGEVDAAVSTATAAAFAAVDVAAQETRDASNAAVTPVENANAVCTPAPSGTTPICVTGVGRTVTGYERSVCFWLTEQGLHYTVGYLTDRCYTPYP